MKNKSLTKAIVLHITLLTFICAWMIMSTANSQDTIKTTIHNIEAELKDLKKDSESTSIEIKLIQDRIKEISDHLPK